MLSGVRLGRAYLPGMKERNWGRIVFISSESAINTPAEMIHYGMTKTAQLAVSRGLAQSCAGTAVTVMRCSVQRVPPVRGRESRPFPPNSHLLELAGGFWDRIGQVRGRSGDLHHEGEGESISVITGPRFEPATHRAEAPAGTGTVMSSYVPIPWGVCPSAAVRCRPACRP